MKSKFPFLLLAVLLCFALPVSASAAETQAQVVYDGIVSSQTARHGAENAQAWLNGALAEGAGVTSEWYVLALCQSEAYDFSAYEDTLLSYLSSHEVYSATTRQKLALALIGVGSTDPYIRTVLDGTIGEMGVVSEIFGLHLLNNGYASLSHTQASLTQTLLLRQTPDGGWALAGEVADVDVTAMAVAALAPQYPTNENVRDAIDRALVLLSARQTEVGGYIAYGVENAESVAQVIIALSSLGIDCETDTRFIKNGRTLWDRLSDFRLSDGSFCHTEGGAFNENATSQTLLSATAYLRMRAGRASVYLLDRRDPANLRELPTEPSVPENPVAPSQEEDTDGENLGYKPWAIGGVILLGAGIALLLVWKKRGQIQNLVILLVGVVLAVTFVCVTDFQTAEDYYGNTPKKENVIGTVTVSIRCDAAVGRIDADYIPADGVILAPTEIEIAEGDTVYTVLMEITRAERIQMESNGSAETAYIVGIHYLYEHALGGLSGWGYTVNGKSPSVGCGQYVLSPGDVIEWNYTLTLGGAS